ncbi:hypothetical protein AB3S75_041632 [Citrus x aurantiifolia]
MASISSLSNKVLEILIPISTLQNPTFLILLEETPSGEWCALGGWVALRFLAHNPVVCMVQVPPPASTHKLGIEDGMDCIVFDGKLQNQKLLPPPADLPKC